MDTYLHRGLAANSGLAGISFKSGSFLRVMFLHHVNDMEHDLKQNIYAGMEPISRIPA